MSPDECAIQAGDGGLATTTRDGCGGDDMGWTSKSFFTSVGRLLVRHTEGHGRLILHCMVLSGVFGFRHSGDATHASGQQGVRDAEPNGSFGISTTLDPPVRSDSRGFRRLRP